MDSELYSVATLDLTYADGPKDPYPVDPAVKQSLEIFHGDPDRLREEVEDNWEYVARLSLSHSGMGAG